MGFSFEGFVLRAPRTAPSNATTTEEAVNGVDRDFKALSSVYQIDSPELVELAADQYRASTLLGADVQIEYVVWAANTANLADLGGFVQNDATGTIPTGVLVVDNLIEPEEPYTDGTNRVVIIDDANRSIATVTELVVRRGDTQTDLNIAFGGEFNVTQSVFKITNPDTLELLGGGLSDDRGDSIQSIEYTVQAPTFWWSRNDQYENRFNWSGQRQRWEPIKGTPPRDLGPLLADTEYTLSPAPSTLSAGSFLPGDSDDPDSFCMVRIGSRPNSASTPVAEPVAASGFGGIKIVSEDELEDFDFGAEPTLSGVVGQASGTLLWNPSFVEEFAGQTIFYSYQGFVIQDQIETIGGLLNANLEERFIAPLPGPTDYPFIRLGSRQALEAIMVDSDALLSSFVPEEGQVGVSLSTGKLKFAEVDEDKANPDSVLFDQLYLGADIFYDGVSLTQRPVPLREAVQIVNGGGNATTVNGKDHQIYIPDAIPTPSPGTSGVIFRPDGTGTIPNTSTDPGVRPGSGSGLVRDLRGSWDLVLFGKSGQFTTLEIIDDDDERPRFRFRIPKGTAFIDRREGSGGSEVILGRDDLKRFDGDALWFLQSGITPSVFADEARMVSRVRNEFTLEGTEVFVFAIDGNDFTWEAADDSGGVSTSEGGTFTPEEIATSIDAVITTAGEAVAQLGRVIIRTDSIVNGKRVGDIEIGYGPGGTKDLSGPAALGFLPGWKVTVNSPEEESDLRWLPDNGTHLGVFRSPLNLNGSKDEISDINSVGRFNNVVLSNSITASPIVLLDKVPLEEIAGYDEGVFFRMLAGIRTITLENFEEVYYEFGLERFSWADEHRFLGNIEQVTNNIFLGRNQVIEDSFLLPSKGMRLSERGQPFEDQILNEDFLLPDGGASGTALFIINVGPRVTLGGRGQFGANSTTFTDPSGDVDFVALEVKEGYQLKILQGDAEGTYVVSADATATNSLEVDPAFLFSGETIPWELYEGVNEDEFDLGIVADVQYVQFQHLPEEPWQIRVLSPLGALPANPAEQEANRLQAVVGPALASNRPISIRFGLVDTSPTASLIRLSQTNLGTIRNSILTVPDPTGTRFVEDGFSIRVGDKTYTFANGDLIKIPGALTFPLAGDVIEVQEVSGLLNFGSDVFVQFSGQDAIYVEEFLNPDFVATQTVEFKFQDGLLNFATVDMTNLAGTETYFVEQMVVAGGEDVTINPVQGSFLFTTPLREFQIVETEYLRAVQGSGDVLLEPTDPDDPESLAPVKVIEQLPLFVRLEVTTAEGTLPEDRWRFNPTDRTVREDVEPSLWVGSTLYNVGSSPTATFDFNTSTAILEQAVEDPLVRMTYAVLEAFGGEQTYTVSQGPVYRPPFRIEADRTRFTLETDRTGDVVPGKLLRVGQFPFYITDSTFDPATNITTVEFLPETQLEAGSRNPGSDSLSLLTDIPLAKTYNSEAPDGFWIEVIAAYEPINRGFQSLFFQGDLTALAVAGHLLELGGDPFIIAGSSQSEDGTKTQVDITSFFPRGYAFGQDVARISARPVYAPLPLLFLGRGGVVLEEGFELILFGEKDDTGNLLPGRTLRPTIDYTLNEDDGAIEFLNPPQAALQPTQSIYLRHVQQRFLAPLLSDEVVLTPRVDARFVHVEAPSEENNVLGQVLLATYTFANPDTFFYRTLPLLSYMAEVAQEVAQDIAAQLPSVGPAPVVAPPQNNDTQGRIGLKSELGDLGDIDRAARVFLEFYNETVLAFEQVQETISGNIVGDRDGKFKFFIGRDKELPPPGYEDAISGRLNQRNIFSELFFAYNPKVTFLRRDPLVNPFDFEIADDQLEGAYIDPDLLSDLIAQQRLFIQNDVDDVVLIGRRRKRLRLFPLRLEAFGRYRRMGSPSRFSRIFPERAEVFTLTDPGIGADLESDPIDRGVYSFRKRVQRLSFKGSGGSFKVQLPKRASTFFKSIGDIGNPVLGQIENVASVNIRNRLPRARVFLYSDTGFPEFDAEITAAGGTPFGTDPRPAVIASIVPLNEFPVGEGGLPDITQLAAQGGEVVDLTTGDPDLFTPQWVGALAPSGLQKIAFGRPDGRIIDVVSANSFTFEFPPGTENTTTRKIFIEEVLLGCIVTFQDDDGNIILPEELLEEAVDPETANPPIELNPGDTILVTPPEVDWRDGGDANDPVTQEQKEAIVKGLPNYRIHFDVRLDKADGEFVDISAPSFEDPSIFGIKEILGQNPPLPISNLEGTASFRNSLTEPAPIPALVGGPLNDSGDYSLPYLIAPDTEKDRLGVAQELFTNFFEDTAEPGALYPDEILGADGTILGAASGTTPPAVIFTAVDALPVTNAGYTPNSGIGDARAFDFLFVETGQGAKGLPNGSMGMLSIGGVSTGSSLLEPPRFVTPSLVGDRIRYSLKTAMSFVNQGVINNPPGMVVRRVGTVTQFDITQISTGILVFNDGTAAAISGGLNNLFTLASDNLLTLNLFTAPDEANPAPVFLQSVLIDFGAGGATGDAGFSAFGGGGVTADDNIIYVDTGAAFVTIAPNPGLVPPILPEDPLNPGETIPLWFTIDIDLTVGGAGTSTTGFVGNDRLTFNEAYDLRTVLPRTEPVVAGVPVASELDVAFVTSETTDANTVNSVAAGQVNGASPFTFLLPDAVGGKVGTFDTSTGLGTVKVMSFEGHGNTPIVTNDPITFSALASNQFPPEDEGADPILTGTAVTGIGATENYRLRNVGVVLGNGAVSNVLPGDICVIQGSRDAAPKAATNAGTYLVKHAIQPNVSTQFRNLTLPTKLLPYNTGAGWAQVQFPRVVAMNVDSDNQVVVDNTTLRDGTTSAWPTPAPKQNIYFINTLDPSAASTINLVAEYSSVDNTTNTFTIDPTTITDLAGNPKTPAELDDEVSVDTLVTGFSRFDTLMDHATDNLSGQPLPRNLVGFDDPAFPGFVAVAGFFGVEFAGDAGTINYVSGGANDIIPVPAVAGSLGIEVATPIANTSFDSDEDAYVYENVPLYVEFVPSDLSVLNSNSVEGLWPGNPAANTATTIITQVPGPVGAFRAQGGVFFEPSVPRPTLDLNGADERVVDAGNSVPASTIGYRDPATFNEDPAEAVTFEVRRIRRFHDVQNTVAEVIAGMRFVYETRRGTVTAFGSAPVGTDSDIQPFVVTSDGGTQLGGFDDSDVNITPGDQFRLLNADGTLLESVEIGGIEGPDQIWLKEPGFTKIDAGDVDGKSFEIYIRNVPVPHEQSNEQLLDLITDRVLLERTVDYVSQEGGTVPGEPEPTDPRRLQDTDDTIVFSSFVQVGDIVLIDPAGSLEGPSGNAPATGQEFGTRPFGDRSVPNRTTAEGSQEVPFIAGQPSELDDNRGWYRVTETASDSVTVSSATLFTNDVGGGFVTFGVEAEYAVYPTISGSIAPFADPAGGPGVEGQMDLRPTAFAGTFGSPTDSFGGNRMSVGPFSYKIFRPSTLFSDEAVDLVLSMRERTLSFLEEFDVLFQGFKAGTYFVFQRDQHIGDLGEPTNPDDGKGLMSNSFVDGIRGLVNISPYANNSDGLSVLDRRFWINDFRLDSEFPPFQAGVPSYSTLESNANNPAAEEGDGRPVLPDYIDDVLDNNDQFRELRFAWLSFRTSREDGTLVAEGRFLEELPKRLRAALKSLRVTQSLKSAQDAVEGFIG